MRFGVLSTLGIICGPVKYKNQDICSQNTVEGQGKDNSDRFYIREISFSCHKFPLTFFLILNLRLRFIRSPDTGHRKKLKFHPCGWKRESNWVFQEMFWLFCKESIPSTHKTINCYVRPSLSKFFSSFAVKIARQACLLVGLSVVIAPLVSVRVMGGTLEKMLLYGYNRIWKFWLK